jgi:hypothetical protein
MEIVSTTMIVLFISPPDSGEISIINLCREMSTALKVGELPDRRNNINRREALWDGNYNNLVF